MAQLRELRVVVDQPVVAAGEESDRVDGGALQGLNEPVRVELAADAGDLLGSVEIQVDLTECELGHGFFHRDGAAWAGVMTPQARRAPALPVGWVV